MTDSQKALHLKRGQIMERITHERAAFFQKTAPLAQALGRVDRARHFVDKTRAFVRSHPFLLATAGSLVFFKKPRFFLRLFYQGFLLWRFWTQLQEKPKNLKDRAVSYLRTYFGAKKIFAKKP